MKAKRIYDFRGYTGPDVSMEISLHEYGIAWKYNKKDKDYTFVYGVSMGENEWGSEEYTLFAYSHTSQASWEKMIGEEWFNLSGFLDFMGLGESMVENWSDFPTYIHTAIQYHGVENIFGSCYHEGFRII